MTRLLAVLAVCAGCATPPVVDHNNAYTEGRLPGSAVTKTLLGSAINVSQSPGSAFKGNIGGCTFNGAGALTCTGAASFGALTVTGGATLSGGTVTIGGSNDLTFSGSSFINMGANGAIALASPVMIRTAPTVSSGFGSSPSIVTSNGTIAIKINVGTGGVATTGVIGLPAATTGWFCSCEDVTTQNTTVARTRQTGIGTTTTCPIGNFTSADVAGAWAASDILLCNAVAY